MRNPDNQVYLHHILDAAAKIDRFLQAVDQARFRSDDIVQSAVMYQVQIIGEAVRHVTREFRAHYPEIPWQEIAGMHSRLVHDYFGIDLQAAWEAATEDVPRLVIQIRNILDELASGELRG